MREVLNTNFIRTAQAKGLPMHRVIWKHAMKPAMLPVLSYLGPTFVGMITGSVVIDSFFSTGGIGTFFVNSAFTGDYSVMMGITILVGALTISSTFWWTSLCRDRPEDPLFSERKITCFPILHLGTV